MFVNCRRGTGFFSKLNLEGYGDGYGVFTNNHVLGTVVEAENAVATFGFEGSSVGEKVKLRPEIMFRTQKVSFNCLLGIIPRDQMTYNDKEMADWRLCWWNKPNKLIRIITWPRLRFLVCANVQHNSMRNVYGKSKVNFA